MNNALLSFPEELVAVFRPTLLSAEQSGKDVVKVVENLKAEDSGKFFSHDGTELPW